MHLSPYAPVTQAEEDEGQDSSKPEVVEGDGDPPELWVLSPLAEAAAAGDQYIVELLLEVRRRVVDVGENAC